MSATMTAERTAKTLALGDEDTLRQVRAQVKALLESSPAFYQLTPEERRDLAGLMVQVCAYMVDPDRVFSTALQKQADVAEAQGAPLAEAQADPVEQAKEKASSKIGTFAGKDFVAGAAKQGVEQFGALVQKVDFPQFVAGLINGVFKSIVDSSIQQMRAYGELLANVSKSVDQFARDNITENNAMDYLSQKYPDDLEVGTEGMSQGQAAGDALAGDATGGTQPAPAAKPVLTSKAEDPAASAKKISDDLGVQPPVTDLSDETQRQRLILSARLEMAKSRQQLLASMVMLGINRIVVTDGLIHAKVIFDVATTDTAHRVAKASLYDQNQLTTKTDINASYGSWWSPWSASVSSEIATDHVTTVQSSVDETSDAKAQMKANLTGEVRVNFKSDYLPMEKMASPQMIAAIQGNAQPPEKAHPTV